MGGEGAVVQRVELSNGITLACVSAGPASATPVLLLHAWGESGRAFDRLLPLLPPTVRAVAIDQRGHGEADKPSTGYRLADFADDVVAFMDAVGLASAVLLGSSSGGYVAQQVTAANPRRVAGLVLVGAPGTLRGRPSFADEVHQLADPVDEAWVRASLTWFPMFHHVPDSYVDERVRDGVRVPAHVWRETFDGLLAAVPPTETATISTPTLIVWGERDEVLSRGQQEKLAEAIPGSRLVVYEDTGHLVLWEQPERLGHDVGVFVESIAPSD